MRLDEAKQILKKNGYLIEDTETNDDEVAELENEWDRKWGNVSDKALDNLNKKIQNVRHKHMNLEDKVNKAQNYNIMQFFTGLEERLNQYYENFTVDHMYYDTKQNFQPTSYWFDDDNLEFQVDYWDEKGFIDLGLIDIKKGTRKNKKFKITKTDENIEEVFNWFRLKVDNYDQREW